MWKLHPLKGDSAPEVARAAVVAAVVAVVVVVGELLLLLYDSARADADLETERGDKSDVVEEAENARGNVGEAQGDGGDALVGGSEERDGKHALERGERDAGIEQASGDDEAGGVL